MSLAQRVQTAWRNATEPYEPNPQTRPGGINTKASVTASCPGSHTYYRARAGSVRNQTVLDHQEYS